MHVGIGYKKFMSFQLQSGEKVGTGKITFLKFLLKSNTVFFSKTEKNRKPPIFVRVQ